MKIAKKILPYILNVQIISALIWAGTIIACSFITKEPQISTILITAAGFHFVLLSTKSAGKKCTQ